MSQKWRTLQARWGKHQGVKESQHCKISICVNSLPPSPSFVWRPAVMMMDEQGIYRERTYIKMHFILYLGSLRCNVGCKQSFVFSFYQLYVYLPFKTLRPWKNSRQSSSLFFTWG